MKFPHWAIIIQGKLDKSSSSVIWVSQLFCIITARRKLILKVRLCLFEIFKAKRHRFFQNVLFSKRLWSFFGKIWNWILHFALFDWDYHHLHLEWNSYFYSVNSWSDHSITYVGNCWYTTSTLWYCRIQLHISGI